jgi:MFS family permease
VTLAAAIVDVHALLELVYVSLIAGVGICVVYAIAVVGITRSHEHKRANQRGAATLYAAVATIAVGACVWAVVAGIMVMTQK